jgi:type VI secretion system protein ImpA
MLDYEGLIAPLSDDAPCGPDLRGDPEFRDIEDAPGDFANLKAPELLAVVQRCDALLRQTKDQAPAIVAMQAAVRVGDLVLVNAALTLLKGYAEEYWEDFHPGPAEEMVVARINELTALARPAAMTLPLQRMSLAKLPAPSTQGFTAAMVALACAPAPEWSSDDEASLAKQVEGGHVSATQARTVRPNREGARSLRMIMRVLSPEARAADAEADIGSEDTGMDTATLRGVALDLRGQVEAAVAQLQAMSDLFYDLNAVYDARAGDSASLGPVLGVLKGAIDDSTRFLAVFPAEEPAGSSAESDGEGNDSDAAGSDTGGTGGGSAAGGKPRGFVVTTPQSRADVVTALDAISRFFNEHEPTSPVPLMLKRVRAWVDMDFFQLLNEIAPSALDDAQRLLASPKDESIDEY